MGANAIKTATASSINFTNSQGQDVVISFNAGLSTGTITRNGTLLASNVTGLKFTYYDDTGTPTADVAKIRRVAVAINVDASGSGIVALRSEILPRGFAYQNFQ